MIHEQLSENPVEKEYDFETGFREIINRIDQLLSEQDAVVVSISGPSQNDTNVGKTTLGGKIEKELSLKNIPHKSAADPSLIKKHFVKNIELSQKKYKSSKIVIILDALGSPGELNENKIEQFKNLQDQIIREAAEDIKLPLTKIDIRILIYRPDRGATEKEKENYADLVIRNDQAEDKKRF